MTTEADTKNLKEKIENLQKDIERLQEISVMHSLIIDRLSSHDLAILKHLDDTLAKQDELDHVKEDISHVKEDISHIKEDISQVKALLLIQIYATILNNNT